MFEILIFSENKQVAFELLSEAGKLKGALNARVAAAVMPNSDVNDYFGYGADKVYVLEDAALAEFSPDRYAEAFEKISNQNGTDILLIGSTRRGKELAPRIAQRLSAGCITDAIGISLKGSDLVAERYVLGGNTIASESIKTGKKVISVMPRAFKTGEKQTRSGEVARINLNLDASKIKVLERKPKSGHTANLEEARTLVCVGRGLRQKEDLAIFEKFAGSINAELGCTRPIAYDLKWLPEEREVGLSGKKCKPDLCMVFGISGQIQHTVGIRDSKIIVAVNKDKNAPIFKISDYGIIGDIFEIAPKLVERANTPKS